MRDSFVSSLIIYLIKYRLSIGGSTILCKVFVTDWVETVLTTGEGNRGDNPSWTYGGGKRKAPDGLETTESPMAISAHRGRGKC
jgi:hypothetical protein